MLDEIRNIFRGTDYIYPPYNNCIYHSFRIVFHVVRRRPEGSDQTDSAMTRE